MTESTRPIALLPDRVVLETDYAASAWARHFNVSESVSYTHLTLPTNREV